MQGNPGDSEEEQAKGKCFAYTLSISRDKKTWLKLFDYSSFACWGTQDLPFPRQAAMSVFIELSEPHEHV